MSQEGGNSQDEVNANSLHNDRIVENSERDASNHENSGKIYCKTFFSLFLNCFYSFFFCHSRAKSESGSSTERKSILI